jgi:hypothetical protein
MKSKTILWAVGGLIVLLLVFKAGMSVGYKKAGFSYRWGENYHRNFSGPRHGFMNDFFSDKKDFIESNGAFGQIISVNGGTIVMRGRDNVEKIVLVKEDTTITRFREKVELSALKADDFIVAIGEPNSAGQIEARFIRIMPPPVNQVH